MSDPVLGEEERELLQTLMDSPDRKLSLSFGMQGIVYIGHEKTIHERGLIRFENILEGLVERGLLRRTDRVHNIFCPQCSYPNVYSRYSCPTCHTTNLTQVQLVQHPFCGFIGQMAQYQVGEGLRCPNCGTGIDEQADPSDKTGVKTLGFHFQCENQHKFNRPEVSHLCPNCQGKFGHKESNYRPIHDYEPTERAVSLLGKEVDTEAALDEAQRLLEQHGFTARRNDEIVGYSSSTHRFSLTGRNPTRVILIEVAKLGTKDELTILLGKKIDIENGAAVFLNTNADNELISLGQVYGITIVNLKEENWANILNSWLEETTAKEKRKSLLERIR